jgi:hypothetical protein
MRSVHVPNTVVRKKEITAAALNTVLASTHIQMA